MTLHKTVPYNSFKLPHVLKWEYLHEIYCYDYRTKELY
ncbi:hypothetical protein HYP07_gp003 [Vibrio phage JSF3]|uniref:Uncharacterized protein n=2 Tax=Pacinivirus VCO139 TaxID=2846607 RepID=R9R4P6_9CAUD|nr:hypothetical protein M612_gp25 [Vibrio phage JA-1]YP_009874381.1 hypothetical protein HYO77_gp24 [Vibrio phage VCO139]YP_009876228.1 hypothetical protein HYP07_gp003 [Vibrio phage JSF3]AGI61830.1 hypothetical protein JA1_0078 [Vibrio phage JA-1]AGI61906.1 hypothetical protein VCO139_0080 [Vibrio phage VCO139]APD18015.1 hypothetical protein [Vibrio phage JSF3]